MNAIRSLRASGGIEPSRRITVHLRPHGDTGADELAAFASRIGLLARAEVHVGDLPGEEIPALRHVEGDVDVAIPLAGAIDLDAERERLGRERQKIESQLAGCRKKLGNASFVERAPEAVVEKEKSRAAALEAQLAKVDALLGQLGAGG